jgi:hypothetical protein
MKHAPRLLAMLATMGLLSLCGCEVPASQTPYHSPYYYDTYYDTTPYYGGSYYRAPYYSNGFYDPFPLYSYHHGYYAYPHHHRR